MPHDSPSEENSFINQELNAGGDTSFILDDHLVHILNQMFMPPKLMTKYEDQDSEEIASLTSGTEMKSYNGNL